MKEQGKIKILGLLDNPCGGSRYHRVKLPLEALNGKEIDVKGEKCTIEVAFLSKSHEDFYLLEQDVKNYDVIWTNFVHGTKDSFISVWREKYGFIYICDTDDYHELPENHIQKGRDYTKILQQLVNADAVIVASNQLAAKYHSTNDRLQVSENFLPVKEYVKEESSKVRLGILGSISHINDWLSIRNVIKKLADDSDIQKKCKFVICGYVADKYWDKIVKMFKVNPNMEVEVVEGLDVENYMSLYSKIDILLAPLEDNEWNFCKSNLKILEAALTNTVVVGSDIYTSKNGGALYAVKKKSDWYKIIKWLIKDENYKKVDFTEILKTNKFDERIEKLRLLLEYCLNNPVEKPENLHIWGITYSDEQSTEYTQYDNSHIRTVEQKSYLYESNPMIDIIDNKLADVKEDDYVGIFSYKFPFKTNIGNRLLYKIFREIGGETDVMGLSTTFLKRNYLQFTEFQHPGFMSLFTKICADLNLEVREPKAIVWSNFFLAKKSIYTRFVNEIIKPAIELMETKYKEEAFKDADYKSGASPEKLKELTGMEYYSLHTFVLERLLSIYLENHPEITFLQVN